MSEPDNENAPRLIPHSYAIVPIRAIQDRWLKRADWAVLTAICFHANTAGYAFPSQERLAELTGLCRQTVNACVGRLRQLGYLKIVKSSKEARRSGGRFAVNGYVVDRKPLPKENISSGAGRRVGSVTDTDAVVTVPDTPCRLQG